MKSGPVLLPLLLAGAVLTMMSGASVADQPGKSVYETNCALCHQRDGAGLAGQFPRLRGRVGLMMARPELRRYATDVVLNGMAGSVEIDHSTLVGVMPGFRQLSDHDIAAVLAYVAALDGHAVRIKDSEVAQARAAGPQEPNAMHDRRVQLTSAGVMP